MYCPQCGAQTADDTKYCRACGQSLTLISQAMTKSPPADGADPQKLEKAIKKITLGIGFLIVTGVVAIFFPPGPAIPLITLIAGIVLLSLGVAEVLWRAISGAYPRSSVDRATVKDTGPMLSEPQPSVTEVTTRNLDMSAEHSGNK